MVYCFYIENGIIYNLDKYFKASCVENIIDLFTKVDPEESFDFFHIDDNLLEIKVFLNHEYYQFITSNTAINNVLYLGWRQESNNIIKNLEKDLEELYRKFTN